MTPPMITISFPHNNQAAKNAAAKLVKAKPNECILLTVEEYEALRELQVVEEPQQPTIKDQ